MVLLYHGPKPLLTPFFPFLRSINYDCAPQCNKSFTPSLSTWFWLKIWPFSFPWMYGVAHDHVLLAASCTSEWKTAFGVVPRSYPDIASSWWRTWTSRSACSSWSWTPSSLVLSYFSELSHPGDPAASRPHFWWRTWDRLQRLLRNWTYFYLHMVFSSRRWSLLLVARPDPSTTSQ